MVKESTAENEEVESDNLTESPTVEEKTPETEVESVQPEEVDTEQTEQATEETEVKGGRKFSGAEKRIHELVDEKKSLEEKTKSLEQKVQELTGGYTPQSQAGLPQSTVQPGQELSVEDYQRQVAETADAIVSIRLNQQQIVNNVNKEAADSVKAYPELDPDNKETFDKDLSDSVTEATLAYIKSNPTGSVKKFVDKLMKPYKTSLERRVGQDTEKVAKQVSEAALRPTSIKGKEKSFEDLSPEEMEKKLGVVY